MARSIKIACKVALVLLALLVPICGAGAEQLLRVGVYPYKPLIFKDDTGRVQGLYPDLLEDIARREAFKVEYVEGSWLECLERLEAGRIDLLPAIAYSPERAALYRFSRETVLTNWGQLYTRPGLQLASFMDLNAKKIAVYRQGIFSEALIKLTRELGLECTFIAAEDYDTIFRFIEEGRVDAGVANHLFGLMRASDYRIARSTIIFMPTELRFAAPRQAPTDLLDIIDSHIAQLKADKASTYYASINRWAVDRWVTMTQQKRWARWALGGFAGALVAAVMLLGASMWLRRQVRLKAEALVHRDRELDRQIEAKEFTGRALKEKERTLATLMGNLPGMVYRCRADHRRTVEFVSSGSRTLLGYAPEDFSTGRIECLGRLVHPDDAAAVADGIAAATAQNAPYRMVYRMKSGSGSYKWIGDQGAVVAAEAGTIFEGFIADITQQQETELALRRENEKLRAGMKDRYRLGGILGKSLVMQQVYEMILKAGASDDPVVITGESGTGKELAARAIHDLSRRAGGPFVPVNCGAIPENLLERELFGHVKGAFTGADDSKGGLLDAAGGGTLFLDEIGDIPGVMQVKLLRAIEGGGYTPVGGTEVKRADIRIVAATNKNLDRLVESGFLREDFYYRLHVLPVRLPPLRRRREDIPLLVEHFLAKVDEVARPAFGANVMEALSGYHWPGNVRELQNVVHRYVALGTLDLDSKKALPASVGQDDSDPPDASEVLDLRAAVERFEKQHIERLLRQHNWHRGTVAEILNINRKTLFSKIKTYRIKKS